MYSLRSPHYMLIIVRSGFYQKSMLGLIDDGLREAFGVEEERRGR
ncbi:Protein of unknown function [Pyronema omphalodes CBS 100304]|uniref:Uncharacterized protein n=1 Tax=Pyronema omphalodes (strain CBS 100304) TaxID=1076935 RepID=U4LD50_PYROM|nr:Protein of unknown function [Pyronema omphalodes CBS 100304]